LQWMLLRNNSSYLIKGAHGQTFTTEPNNLKGKNSFRHNGLIHKKTVGVTVSADNKGIVLTTRKQTARHRPGKSLNKVTFKNASGSRRVLSKIRATLSKSSYRNDLKTTCLRRASALLRGQKPAKAVAAVADKKTKKADK